jgi:hypothetical protein
VWPRWRIFSSIGEVVYRGETDTGEHASIIDRPTFDAVQAGSSNTVTATLNTRRAAFPPQFRAARRSLRNLEPAGSVDGGEMALTFKAAVAALILVGGFADSVVAGPLGDAAATHGRGDYATALRLWSPLAAQGNPTAQHNPANGGLGVAPLEFGVNDASAADDCVTESNLVPPKGTRWHYHVDRATNRKCWFLMKLPTAPAPQTRYALPRLTEARVSPHPRTSPAASHIGQRRQRELTESKQKALFFEFLRWKEQQGAANSNAVEGLRGTTGPEER